MPKKLPSLTIAVAQPLAVPGDVPENLRRMKPMIAEASRRGAELILFSECGVNGYDLDNISTGKALTLKDKPLDQIAAMAKKYRIVIVAGFYERVDKKGPKGFPTIYNSAVAFFPNGKRVLQRKGNVIAHEKDHTPAVSAPRDRKIFKVGPLKCAILICADGGMPGIAEELAKKGVDVVLCPTAGMGRADWTMREADLAKPDGLENYLKKAESVGFPTGGIKRAIELGMGMASSNQAGFDPKINFFHPGHSMVIDTNGDLTALICGRMICERVKPELAIGVVHKRAKR